MFNFLVIIFVFFSNIANCFANDDIYFIENNEIFLENNGNVLELRERAKNISFQNSFNILARKILDPTDFRKFQQLQDIEISNLIKDYKFQSEKIKDTNYFANISINFSKEKVKKFFINNKIKINVIISEEYLVIPLFKKFNTFYLWEKDNFWYDELIQEYDKRSLLKLFFPKKNHLNKFRITPSNLVNENSLKIQEFLDFHKKKKAIILFLEEDFDTMENKFRSKLLTKLFFNSKFIEINLLKNKALYDNSDSSIIELIAKQVIIDLENWWKNKIDDYDFKEDNKNEFDILIKTDDLKKVLYVEKIIKDILNENDLNIKEINQNFIVYKIQSNFSVERLNLALESKNLIIKKSDSEDLYLIDYN